MTPEERTAKEAARVLSEPLFIRAMDAVRAEAQNALCDPEVADNPREIMRLQAIANCLPEVRNWLEAQLIKAATSGFDPNEQSE